MNAKTSATAVSGLAAPAQRRQFRSAGYTTKATTLGLSGRADAQRIGADEPCDVLELRRTEIGDLHIEPAAHLPIGVLGKADRARFGDAFQSGGDVDAVAHQVAVTLLDNAEMDADAELDALIRRRSDVALDHRVLNCDGAPHRFDDAAKFDQSPVAGALEQLAVLARDRRVDEVDAQRPQPRERAVLVRARHAAEADDVGARIAAILRVSAITHPERREPSTNRYRANVAFGSTPASRIEYQASGSHSEQRGP